MRQKGIYVEMAHHPQVILDSLERVEQAVQLVSARQKTGCILPAVLVGLGALGFVSILVFQSEGFGPFILSFLAFIVGILLLVVLRPHQAPLLREHFEAARQILHTLRDDTGRKGRVVGWLDLTGPQQKEKTARTARSAGGKQKAYYRDPWFKVKIELADGNLLRLTVEDKVKAKAGSIVGHQSEVTAKLVVNPSLYRLGAVPSSGIPLSNARLFDEDGTFTVKAASSAASFSAIPLLETLRMVYGYLEIIGPESPFASQEAGTEG